MNDAQIAEELLRLKNNALYLQRRIERLSAALPELSGVSILPSTSVVSETAYDLTPSVGTSPKYARGDHTHGSVAAGGGANHAILSAVHTDSLAAAVARGDLIIGNSTPKWTRLAKGAANEVLKSDGTDPSWANVAYGELTGIPASFTPSIHNVLDSSYHGDVVTNPPVRGGLIVGDYTPKWIRLSPSTQYKVLQIIGVAGDLGWGWVDYSQLTNVPATFTPNAHALLSAYHSDTLTGIPVRGDLLIGNSTPKWAKLGIGTVGKFLKSDGTDPSWQLLPAYPESQTLLADASGVTMTNIGTSYVEVPTSTACRIKTDMALWGQCSKPAASSAW